MPKQLSPDQVEQFWNDGFLFPVDAFDGVQAKKYRNLLEEQSGTIPGKFMRNTVTTPTTSSNFSMKLPTTR